MDTVSGLLEDPENAVRVNQPWITHFFRIWRVLANDYSMGTQIANSMFKDTLELAYLETSSTFPFIEPLVQLMKEGDDNNQPRINKPLYHVLEMIAHRACCLYSGDRADRPPPKAYCMIVQNLAVNCHDIMLHDVASVYKLLENPHPNVRMSTLQALADMFSSPYLSQSFCDNFEPRAKKRRTIFEKIVAHTNDEGTNVRAKAVALLRNLMENRRIPEEFESSGFVTVVGSRLQDRSVQVRKATIQFLAAFLDNNRHGHDFNRAAHVEVLDQKSRELRLMNKPRLRVMQEAENTMTRRQFQLRSEIKDQLLALLSGETELDGTAGRLDEVLQSINEDGAGARVARYYARSDRFPIHMNDPEHKEKHGLQLVDECVKFILETLEGDYIHYKVQQLQMDDDQLLEDEQQARDRSHESLQLRAQMQQLIDKMCIEVELTKCVEMTLRCVLMGDSAEIKEGIKFLTRCKLFGISGADDAIRSMCCLVWRPAADIISELIEAAENMFISRLEGNEKASERDKSTVENLMSAMKGVTERDRSSVEEVIYLLAAVELEPVIDDKSKPSRKRKTIESNVIAKLWNIALDTSVGNEERKAVALRILYPISKTEKGLPEARSRLRSLQKKLVEGPVLAVEALRIISILGLPTKQEKDAHAYNKPIFRINPEDSLFRSIEQVFFHEVVKADDDPNRDWFGIMRYSISSILNISMDVNVVLPRLASQFLFRAKRITEFYIFYSNQANEATDANKTAVAARRRDYWALTWCRVMEKLMAFCGELAVQLHAFIQVNIPRLHNRYANKILDAEKNDSKAREEAVRFLTDLEKSIAQRKTIFEVPQDLTPGTSSNTLHHLVALMCDKRMFVPNRLLGRLLPIIVYSLRANTMPLRVKQAALVAYGKYLPLSADISSFAAPSFFTAMMGSESTLVRCNLIAACCDFAFAQPTLFELYAPSLFRMSQDESPLARESTILVLSHLMSNDMIQTRGVLSEPARCISDSVRSVREAAESFFRELNQRSDTIIQLLPEFLYRLSSKTERLPMKAYKIVFEFLIQLLKEKSKSSSDTMIDRVCLKFSNIDMNDTEAPKYLLIALSKFAQSDGGLTRLQDNWRHWSKFLCQPQVAREFRHMVEHLQSSSKSEDFKNHCSELIANIDKIQEEGLRKEDITAAPAAAKRGGRGRKPAAAAVAKDSDDVPGPSTRTPKKRRRRAVSEESEESPAADSDFE
ncbi:hypothetical protein GCK72_010399 [Caenorhabditis remanei]|uniref:Condensin complex subunit 1 n=1 Tax=Caenorhabditis remanei TaxID=31234 RepID=A0A6A5H4N1_CAERE|nr:hypothetical protein GCK72_010399 [Caenorhabditis remanei]KAF1762137.1 hypothetical protein GCK72_010399 [Caenorhabditis remanei]